MYYNGVNAINSNCPICFSIGSRSTGKSFFWKRYCIKNYIKKGEKFIYLRRNVVDCDISNRTFFDDIGQKFSGYSCVAKDHEYILTKNGNSECCGYFFALTEVSKIKSVALESVTTIFFDEFLPENNRYLKPMDPTYEPNLLLSLYFTVARGYNKPIRDNVLLICAANMISLYNPYFSFFKIDLTRVNKQVVNYVYAERVENEAIKDIINQSKFGKILSGTSYGSYAVDNESLFRFDRHISKVPAKSKIFCALFCYMWYLVFYDDTGNIYIKPGYDTTLKSKFRITDDCPEDVQKFSGDIVKLFRKLYQDDKIYYNSSETRSKVAGFIEY